MKRELKPISLDHYLTCFMFQFIGRMGNHIRINDKQIKLNPAIKFDFLDAPNRNKVVANDVFRNILQWHLKRQYLN